MSEIFISIGKRIIEVKKYYEHCHCVLQMKRIRHWDYM